MNINELPVGSNPKPLDFPHFPTTQQAVIWRNWELVPAERLAQVLKTNRENVLQLAGDMGLRVPPLVNREWLQRGYITIIRNNWHLLPYEQLLALLGWTAEKLAFTLKEDDFLWIKLGYLKPCIEPVCYRTLTDKECSRTEAIKNTVERYFPDIAQKESASPFDFLLTFQKPEPKKSGIKQDLNLTRFDLRLIYSYSAVYGDPLINPDLNPYPDGLLQKYSDLGINGVWLQGILYTLFPWKAAPELSEGYQKRIENLRKLTKRAANFGIGVYLYLNEPRGMPLAFFERHPEWKGVEFPQRGVATLCTSQQPILDYLRESTAWLFQEVPELAGVFTVTMSESATNCYSLGNVEQCPRCSKRSAQEVIAEVNSAIEEGIHSVKLEARIIVWPWGWDPKWAHQAIDLLPDNVELMCTSEEALPTNVGGINGVVADYSISQVGPGQRAIEMWQHARNRGLKTAAKVQLNNTWECSAVPYLPTPDLVEQHLQNLYKTGVSGLMLSWTLGGYPSANLELLGKTSSVLASQTFGKEAGKQIKKAWDTFSKAFKEFPFHISVLYNAPQNYGPMNLLQVKPTGYRATMVGFPYDDLKKWRAIYPEDVFEQQFRKLSEGWKKGLEILQHAKTEVDQDKLDNFAEMQRVATATYCHFRSTYLQVAFIRLRERKNPGTKPKILKIIDEEIELAVTLHGIVRVDSRIGFEASNHYYYTLNDLREKVLNCEYARKIF